MDDGAEHVSYFRLGCCYSNQVRTDTILDASTLRVCVCVCVR